MPEYPLIQFDLTLAGGTGERRSVVPMRYDQRRTPAEVMLLMRAHGAELGAEEEVIQNASWTGDVMMDDRDLRQHLYNRFGKNTVDMMFPGALPAVTQYPDKRAEWAEADRKARLASVGGPPADMEDEAPIEAPKSDIAALRAEYKAVLGKNASPAWDAAALHDRIAAAQKAA